ncbi:MAG TPA: molybdopterin-dependent oxidoreductase [Stellaceae bacterium]|nr:molybdopterin-dependent oxidoreductase [Stellaceae bacterium]
MRRTLLALALVLAAAAAGIAHADEAASAVLDGKVKTALHLTAADLGRMPHVTRKVSFLTDHGTQTATYTGVLLWTLVGKAGIDDPDKKWPALRHVVAVTGKDGYVVLYSLGEMEPEFGNVPIMLAYAKDGAPLADLRIVAPGDKHGARDVRDVVRIEVR